MADAGTLTFLILLYHATATVTASAPAVVFAMAKADSQVYSAFRTQKVVNSRFRNLDKRF